MDEETKKILEEIAYIEELVEPCDWKLKAHYPGAAFEDNEGNRFQLDAVAWDNVKKILEENKSLNYIFELQYKREVPYIKRWQKAVNKPNTIPDYGEFLGFLLDELERKENG